MKLYKFAQTIYIFMVHLTNMFISQVLNFLTKKLYMDFFVADKVILGTNSNKMFKVLDALGLSKIWGTNVTIYL